MQVLKLFLKKLLGTFYLFRFKMIELPKIREVDLIFVFPYYHLGGAEQVHLDIVRSVSDKNVVVFFTHLSATNHFKNAFEKYATVIELNNIINKRNTKITNRLFRLIAHSINTSKSVTHVMGCNTSYYYEIIPYVKKFKIDLIHAFSPDDSRVEMLVNAAPQLDYRVVINQKARQILLEYYRLNKVPKVLESKVHVIGNGVEVNHINLIRKRYSSKVNIGFIGRWSEEKRPQLFLDISSQLKSESINFFMAGSGLNSFKNVIEAAGVNCLGSIHEKDKMNDLYSTLDYLVITSVYEGFPMVLMESMPYGVIPICTNVGGISEHIITGVNGVLINALNSEQIVQQMVEAILKLEKNLNLKSQMSKQAQEYALKYFDIKYFSNAYKSLLCS